ncbi:hypothetical protein BC827DRAFT_1273566 [Russula dissimulans]|nr:hypothetical protein BC827DRAFT_1273566 [Russula dissimulans]
MLDRVRRSPSSRRAKFGFALSSGGADAAGRGARPRTDADGIDEGMQSAREGPPCLVGIALAVGSASRSTSSCGRLLLSHVRGRGSPLLLGRYCSPHLRWACSRIDGVSISVSIAVLLVSSCRAVFLLLACRLRRRPSSSIIVVWPVGIPFEMPPRSRFRTWSRPGPSVDVGA